MLHSSPPTVLWLEAPKLGPGVARCVVVTLPPPISAEGRDRRAGRTRRSPSSCAERLLFTRYCDGGLANGALTNAVAFDSYAIGAACVAMLNRSPETHLATPVGPLLVGPREWVLMEFERNWRRRSKKPAAARPLRTVIDAFEAELDATLLAACPHHWPARYRAYNWLRSQPNEFVRRIEEAATVYPFLWGVLLSGRAAKLRDDLRTDEPIARSLAAALDAQPWQLRALQRAFRARHLNGREFDAEASLLALVQALDLLLPEHVPTTREGWSYLLQARARLPYEAWLRDLGRAGFDALGSGRAVPRFWRPFSRFLGLRRQLKALRDYEDYASRFPDDACLPPTHSTDLRAVVAAYERWRREVDPEVLRYYEARACPPWEQYWVRAPWEAPVYDDELDDWWGGDEADEPLTGAWRPLLAAPTTIAGFQFVELATREALVEEGRTMRHCVRGCASECERRGVHVFSVRTLEGKRESTLEVQRREGGWVIGQHSGKVNCSPKAEVLTAAAEFVATLNGTEDVSCAA